MDAMYIYLSTIWKKEWFLWMNILKLWLKKYIESWKQEKNKFSEYWELIRIKDILTCQKNQYLHKIKKSDNKSILIQRWSILFLFTYLKKQKFQSNNFIKKLSGLCIKRKKCILYYIWNQSYCTHFFYLRHEDRINDLHIES
jgi:hypothetical protein